MGNDQRQERKIQELRLQLADRLNATDQLGDGDKAGHKVAHEIASVTSGLLLTLLAEVATTFAVGKSWLQDLLYVALIIAAVILALTLFTYFLRVRDSSKVSKLKREITSAYLTALRSSRINPETPTQELHA